MSSTSQTQDPRERAPQLSADFSKRAAVHAGRLDWTRSHIRGVDRRMLDRIGDEVGPRYIHRAVSTRSASSTARTHATGTTFALGGGEGAASLAGHL